MGELPPRSAEVNFRERIREEARRAQSILEIGPSYRPIAPKAQGFAVTIFDNASKTELVAKYTGFSVDLGMIEEVDVVSPDLGALKGRVFDCIVASHVVEHMPNLIGFFRSCADLLEPAGRLFLIVPDKRFCFDHHRPLSTTGHVIDAHVLDKRAHYGAVFDQYRYAVSRGGAIAWDAGTRTLLTPVHTFDQAHGALDAALQGAVYQDVHEWTFTPSSFRMILRDLARLDLIELFEADFHTTVGCEFFMVLTKTRRVVHDDLLPAILAELQEADGTGLSLPGENPDKRAAATPRVGTDGGASGAVFHDLARRSVESDLLRTRIATERLYAKLDASDVAQVEAGLDEQDAPIWSAATVQDRKALALSFGVHYGIRDVMEKTGLSDAVPPPEVHAMSRGSLAAGGSYYDADLVVDALLQVGVDLRPAMRVLDFGCSSGRVVRALAAAYPEIEWHGCDPVESSIGWARMHLRNVRFMVSPRSPTLGYPDGFFDFVFAISIWSHFSERAGLQWLEEMRRVIRPTGHLLLTTHGYQSIAHYAQGALRPREQLAQIAEALYARGFWFKNEFGEGGDGGLGGADWGTAFNSVEWLLPRICPDWRLADFAPGRLQGNQDMFVLERR
jgi:cyclopropane fatty-acyl-phospholipid synthase-like methyltransferase